jgi:hypothetical protein
MAFNVADFASNIARYGTLQTNKFEVYIVRRQAGAIGIEGPGISENENVNSLSGTSGGNLTSDESFSAETGWQIHRDRIESVKLPGVTIDTYESRRYGVGPNIKVGTNVRMEPFSISVITDKNYDIYKFFHVWINKVFDYSGRMHSSSQQGLNPSFLTTYKREYVSDVQVKMYENTGLHKNTYMFYRAFPIGITEPSLSWRDNNNIHRFDVTLAYDNWTINNEPGLVDRGQTLSTVRAAIQQAREENPAP